MKLEKKRKQLEQIKQTNGETTIIILSGSSIFFVFGPGPAQFGLSESIGNDGAASYPTHTKFIQRNATLTQHVEKKTIIPMGGSKQIVGRTHMG